MQVENLYFINSSTSLEQDTIMKYHAKGKKRHDSVLREKFGIGLHQYEELYKEQGGRCYLCGCTQKRNLTVDHDHVSGNVRRLLCSPCNQALGLFKDNPQTIMKAAEYVQTNFSLPEDKECRTIPHSERPRWRNIVSTPDGSFNSFEAAGEFYGVHPTTVGHWCGAYKCSSTKVKDGYIYKKVFK